jgi:hypothetical protein
MSHHSAKRPHARLGTTHVALLVAVLAGAVISLLVLPTRSTSADERGRNSIIHLSVTGEGSQTKAYYDGAPPAGSPLQEALTKFANQGYTVAAVGDPYPDSRGSSVTLYTWNILLERK